jgi:lipoate-protein ligase A
MSADTDLAQDPWWMLDSGPCDYDFNMAMDEALVAFAAETSRPVLRFYGWKQPAASFGYSQKIAEVERLTELRPLVRRPTGGGIVPHDADWTYSLVLPTRSSWYRLKAIESYRRVHEWIQGAFVRTGICTVLAPCCLKAGPGQCFVGHEQFDLLCQGRKIAGAAQRRTRVGLLIQGSVQPPAAEKAPTRKEWQEAMVACGSTFLGPDCSSLQPGAEFLERVRELARTKFGFEAYNRKR